ncbi:MAG TPA: helix-turn-helix domain-containing protein [Streptosporangiaceae bacterium]|nr:helix-turn-helix domain-containing protein [Streptosporangiaceae bacterium]
MLLVLELDVADLAATRFAISPLSETTRAMLLMANPSPPAVNLPWVRWAKAQLDRRPLRLPRVWPLIVNELPTHPEFLVPAPAVRAPGLDAELARVRATPAEPVRASLCRVFGDHPWPDSAIELFERPRESLAEIAAELAEFHDRLIMPHWERISPVLEADIAFRAGLLAGGGARSLFSDLHPDLCWSGGTLTLNDTDEGPSRFRVMLGPDGVVLMPSIFNWPLVSLSRATSTQTTLLYPARGAATVWESGVTAGETASGTVDELLGPARARLLVTLRSPATTTALARRMGVTPSAVSQHLTVLHRGGLVDRQRSGRTVLYQTSELGLALLTGGRPRA